MPAQPTILICGCATATEEAARRMRRVVRAAVVTAPDMSAAADRLRRRRPAVVVLTAGDRADLIGQCRQAKRLHGTHTPVLVVTSPTDRSLGVQCLRTVADSLHVTHMDGQGEPTRPPDPGGDDPGLHSTDEAVLWSELGARVQALLRHRRRHDTLRRECNRLERQRRHIEAVHARLDQDLLLAQKLQRSFLPRQLPEVGAVRFATRFFAAGPVAGDIYDVSRLDEHTLGFYVADAVGHGVAAALLTVFVRKAIRPKIISGHSYRILPPGEVLISLNREMLTEELHESSFVTMVYGTIDVRTHTLCYSLAGHPPAILVSDTGRQELLDHSGPLLGVMEEDYPTQTVELECGDKVVLYSEMLEETLRDILPDASAQGLRDDLTLMALEILHPQDDPGT